MSDKPSLLCQLSAITKEMRIIGLQDGLSPDFLAKRMLIFAGQVDTVTEQLNILIEQVEKLAYKLEKAL